VNVQHRALDRRSGLVLDTHDLQRRPGALKTVRTSVEAPEDLGIVVVGVPAGSPIELDLRLESALEGVLVTGVASVAISGECVRCLGPVVDALEIDVQELFVYPGSEAAEDEASRMEGDLIDLEPLLRDSVVVELPFQPLCRPDCAGLCPRCGTNLNDHPEHTHEVALDPRWAALRRFEGNDRQTYDVASKSHNREMRSPAYPVRRGEER
jgi:DUF177 domain-containing protein